MYKTLVVFRAEYLRGVTIDSRITKKWGPQASAHTLMQLVNSKEWKDFLPQEEWNTTMQMVQAFRGMQLRASMNNPHTSRVHIFDTEEEPSDELLISWAETNLYQRKENQDA
jgi:hypothetical protein